MFNTIRDEKLGSAMVYFPSATAPEKASFQPKNPVTKTANAPIPAEAAPPPSQPQLILNKKDKAVLEQFCEMLRGYEREDAVEILEFVRNYLD